MADDWWTHLYDPLAPDTASSTAPATATAGPVRGGGRLPAPGHTVDLDTPADPAPAPDGEQPDTDPGTPADAPDRPDTGPDSPGQAPDTAGEAPDTPPDTTSDTPDTSAEGDQAKGVAQDKEKETDSAETAATLHRVADLLDTVADRIDPAAAAEERARIWGRIAQLATLWTVYNGAAAAAGHYGPASIGHPEWSLPAAVHHVISHVADPTEYHWTTSVVFAGLLNLAAWAVVDRRTRKAWHWLAWVCRIPLASTALGTAAATWTILTHHLTGAPL